MDGDKLFVRVVYGNTTVPEGGENQTTPAPLIATNIVDNQAEVHRSVEAFLKVFDDINLRDEAAEKLSGQGIPAILIVEEDKPKDE
jgi:hypothetical protein